MEINSNSDDINVLLETAALCAERALISITCLGRMPASPQNTLKMGALAYAIHNLPANLGGRYSKPETDEQKKRQIFYLKLEINGYLEAAKLPETEG
ncbi:hypothetical protein [Pseudomonas sp. PLMAX]|uniref:hypothetical protein n=1 Tax=Pseudomonas sp. PLMAX TaxID=2201998 RepID=UPI0038BA8FC1